MQSLKKLDEYQKAVNNYLRTGSVAPTAQPETRTVSDISNEILKKRSPAAVQKLSEYNAYKWLGGKGLSDETMGQLGSQSFYMPEKPFNGAQGTYNQTASLQAFKDRFAMVDKFRSDGIWDVEGNNPYLFSDAFLNDQLNIWNQKLADSRAADEADKQKRNANAEVAARLKALSTDYYHGLTFDELLDVYEGDEDQISAVVSNWMALDQLNNPDSKYPKTWDELRNLETDNEYLAALHDLHEGWTNADWNNVGLVDRYESQTEDILRGMKALQQEQAYRTTLSKFGGLAESAKNVPTLDAYYASNIPGYDPQYHNPEYATNLVYFLNHAVGGQETNLMELLNDGLGEKLLRDSTGINADEDARKVQEYYDRGYHMLLPNELAIINRMANQPEAIQVFLNELEPVLLERRAEYMAAETQMLAQDPLMAIAMSAATVTGQPIASLQSIAGGLTGADPNSSLFDTIRDSAVARHAVGENLGEALPFQVFGEELGTTLYNVGMSMFDMLYARKLGKTAAGGTPDQFASKTMQYIMSSATAASTIYNDLQAGYTHEQAVLHGFLNGLIEAIYEKGFMDELFDFGKGFNARMWGATLAEAGEELGTEITQTIGNELLAFMTGREGEINQIYQANIDAGMNSTQAAFETLKHYGNQFALAGLSGAVMGAGVAGVTGVAEVAEGNYVGNSLKNQGDVEAMLSIAESMADGSEAKNAAEKIRTKQQAGKKVTNRDLGGLVKAVAFDIGAEHSGAVDSVLDEAVENRLLELGEDAANAKALAPVIREVTKGNQIKPKDRQAINWSEKASQVLKELNTVETEDAPAEWTQKAMRTAAEKARPIKAKQMQFREAMTTKTTTTTAVNRAHERARKLSQNKLKLAPEMVAFTDSADGRQKQGKYEKAVRKNGEFYVEVKVDGQKEVVAVPVKDLQGAGDEGLATILEYAAYESRHEMSPEEVNIMAGSYKQQRGDVRGFISQFEESYLSGYSGVKAPPTQMASELQKIAYEHGKAEAAKDEGSRVARASRARATSKGEVSWIGKVKSDEEIKGRGSVEALPAAMENMTESQQTTVRIVQAFADKFKTNIALFDSSGGDVGGIQNGSYDPNTNTVYIDINSGANTTKGITSLNRQGTLGHAMVRTLGHELTHHLEATSADGYRVFKDAVKAEYKKQGKDWSAMVRSKIETAVTAGQKLTYAGAEAEVVADASEYMLQNSKFVAEIDSSVKGKIKHFVQDFMQKLGEVFSKLTGGHIESKLLRQEINGVMQYMGNLQQLWDAAMEESMRAKTNAEIEAEEVSEVNTQFSIREEAPPKKTGIAYKVFFEKDGKLYPPMVANPGGADTPVGVWLNADVGASAPPSKTGRPQVQAGGKGTNASKMSLAFRPGWHLGDIPKATQFDRLNRATGVKELFPYNFVWAECEYAMDVDYQEEAMSYGYNANGKFQHSLAGLPRLPVDGYYHYRTNPNPNTVPWVITGAMKVNRVLSRQEVDDILREKGVEPTKWQGPDGEQMEVGGEEKVQYSPRSVETEEKTSIKDQIRAIQNKLNDMDVVSSVHAPNFNGAREHERKKWILDTLKSSGFKVDIQGFGVVEFGENQINNSLNYLDDPEEIAAFACLPRVLKRGIRTDGHENHKNRRYSTVTFAAPVEINGTRGNMAVVVKQTGKNLYKTHRILMPDGSAFVFNDNEKTEPKPAGGIPSQGKAQATHISSADYIVQKSARNVKPEFDGGSTPEGIEIDGDTESAYPTQKSIRTWEASDYVANRDEAAQRLAKTIGVTVSKAKKWIDDVNSISAYVLDNKARLDYIPTAVKGMSAFKSNPEYGGSIDMSTICAKRRLATGTLDAIQRVLGDAVLTKDDFLNIREMMKERGYEVACGLCFVESSRKNLSKYNRQFLDQYRDEHPDVEIGMVDLNTVEGLEAIRSNPETADIYAAYEKFMNKLAQRKPKLFEKRTEYNHEILKKFKSDTSVGVKNTNGGLCLQSFSDFEIVHLIDMMQVITDMASVGLAGQAYTKVPDFAWALGDTGLKINLSLIAKDVDADGKLVFDDIEGMNHKEAKKLRDAYSKNVGTIVVTFTDEQTIAAMKSDFIDYIIPFHRSQWQKGDYKKLGLPEGTKDYTIHQNEKEGRKRVKENFLPNAYWDFSVPGKQNAINYLNMCADAGRTPKFAKFLVNNGDGSYSLQPDGSTDGYWKLLIDFKMYDNAGNGSRQLPVQPTFNMDQAMRMLADYKGEHDTFPVAQDVVDDFVKEYRGDKGGVKVEDGRYTVNPVQKSIRDLPDEVSVRGFLAESDNSIADTVEERNALSIYQKLLKDHADASDKVMAAERVLAAADEEDRPEARKALTAARAKQKDLYNRLLNVERTAHVQAVVTRTNRLISDLYGKNQADVDNRLSALRSQIESLQADLQGLKGAAKTQREADIRAAKREMDTLESRAVKALLANNERYAKRLAGLYERAEMNAEIGKHTRHIKRIVKRLNDRIIHEEDYKNVKEPMKPAVHKLVQTFIDGFGNLVFDSKQADKLRRVYDLLAKEGSESEWAYSDDVSRWIDELATLAAKDEERRMSGGSSMESVAEKLETYEKVSDIAEHIYHLVKHADEMFVNGKKEQFSQYSAEVGNELIKRKDKDLYVGAAGKALKVLDDLIRRGNMTPVYFFESLKNNGLMKLYDNLMAGQRKYAEAILAGKRAVAEAQKKYNYYTWSRKPQTFKTQQGHTIALTVEQKLWVYATAKREASNELMQTHHLDQGGFRYDANSLPKANAFKAMEGSNEFHKLNTKDVAAISDTLTAEQKAYADTLVEFLSDDMAALGNEASMELFGIRKYNEKHYFPFKTAGDQRYQSSAAGSASTTDDARVRHSPFTHSLTKGAKTALVMGNFTDVVANHINLMSTYSSFVVPIESLNRVLNRKVNAMEDGSGNDVTIRSLVGRKYGDAAQKYIADLLKDMNGGPQVDNRGGLSGLMRVFKRSAVVGSLSVAVQQPTAYIRAFAYVSPKYFTHFTGEGYKATWEKMMKYSGTAVIKDMGRFDVGMGKMADEWIANSGMEGYNVFQRGKFLLDEKGKKAMVDNYVDFATSLPGVLDQVTWTHLWKAIEAEQADLRPGMKRNSEEFLHAVGKRFDEVVNHTQVYDSILSKSQNMRSKNPLTQMSTSFMAEPTLNWNLFTSAFTGGHGKAQAAKMITATVLANVAAAALASAISAWNKDDDERKGLEKYVSTFSSRLFDSLNPATMIPFLSDMWNILSGYDVERLDWSVIKDLYDYTSSFFGKVSEGKEITWRDCENFVGSWANMAGIPAKNVSRDLRRFVNFLNTDHSLPTAFSLKYSLNDELAPVWLWADSGKAYCQRFVAAIADGDTREAYDLWEYMNGTKGVSQPSLETNIRAALKEAVQNGAITTAKATEVLRKYVPYKNDKDNTSKPLEWLKNK